MTTADSTIETQSSHQAPVRSELRQLLGLAMPTVAAKLSHMALGFTDFLFVSRLGTEATAAISPSTLLIYIFLCLGMGSVTSIQTYTAQSLGRREPHRAARYAWQALYMGLLFLLFTIPLVWLQESFWRWVNHPPAVQQMEIEYCSFAFWSMGLAVISVGLEGFFNGIQRPRVELLSILVAVVFNAVGNYALVFGNLGCPKMGVAGSAIATVMAWGIRSAMMFAVFLSKPMDEQYQTRRSWRFSFERMMEVLRLGGPIGIQWLLDVASWFVFLTLIMSKFGTAVMAAANTALQLMHLSFMPAVGLGVAVNTLVGHAIGEKRYDLAARHARSGLWVMMTYMIGAGVLYWLGGPWLMALISSDAEVIAAGAAILIWAAIFQAFDAMCINYIFALRGAGDTKWPSVIVVSQSWVTFIFGGYMVMKFAPGLGIHGPWMMCALYIILCGAALCWRWQRGAWQRIDIFAARRVTTTTEMEEAPV